MITPINSGAHYGAYLEQDIAERVYWKGRAAELLKLEGQVVTRPEWNALSAGKDPETGQRMHDLRGNRERQLYDVSVGLPKSASIMALVDPRIREVQRDSALYVMRFAEDLAQVRTRRFGEEGERNTNNALMVAWHHQLSRSLDPHMHTHLTVMNMSYDREEGKWKALQALDLYRNQNETQAMYRILVAGRLRELGYELEFSKDPKQAPWVFDNNAWKQHLQDLMEEGITEGRGWGRAPAGNVYAQADVSRQMLAQFGDAHPRLREEISHYLSDEFGIPRRSAEVVDLAPRFEIAGVPGELVEKYSQRRNDIEERMAEWEEEHGMAPTPAQADVLAKVERPVKRSAEWEEIRNSILAGMEKGYEDQILTVKVVALEYAQDTKLAEEPAPYYWYELVNEEELRETVKPLVAAAQEKVWEAEQRSESVPKAPRIPDPIMEVMKANGWIKDLEYRVVKSAATGKRLGLDQPDGEAALHVTHWTYGQADSYSAGMHV